MHIGFLHTSAVHVPTFDALLADLAPQARVTHHVAADLLEQARAEGLEVVRNGFSAALDGLLAADAVLCTCSTLGPLADSAALAFSHVVRIDRPMMQAACATGPRIAVALCLDSTRDATLALLHDCARAMGRDATPTVILCTDAWPLFEAGDMAGYAARIAQTVRDAMATRDFDCVVLAQASMGVAAPMLHDTGVAVLSSPRPAAEHVVSVARARVEGIA